MRIGMLPLLAGLVLAGCRPYEISVEQKPVSVTDGWSAHWGDLPLDAAGRPQAEGVEFQPTRAFSRPEGSAPDGILWLRVPIPDGGWGLPALYVASVKGALEVYGPDGLLRRHGEIRPGAREVSEPLRWMLAPLPREALGREVLLRVQSSLPGVPGPERSVRVGSVTDLVQGLMHQGLAPFVVALVLLIVGVVSLGSFARTRSHGMMFFSFYALIAAGILVARSPLTPLVWDAPVLVSRLLVFSAAFFPPALGAFLFSFLPQGRAPWFVRVLQVSASVAALLVGASLLGDGMAGRVLPAVALFVPVTLVLCAVVLVQAVRAGDVDARLILLGALVLVGTVLHDATAVLGLHQSEQAISVHWGFFALALAFAAVVARRAEATSRELVARTRALEAHQEDVRRRAERMTTGATELASVVAQLHASGDAQSEGLTRQAAALQQAQVTAEEIRHTSELAASKAKAMLEAAGDAERVGRACEDALGNTLPLLEGIGQEVARMAERVGGMEARTRQIGGIVETVKALADQSNMLALNAAIEAARSGEQGKGFGVVAREVRSLADQSLQAVSRIQEILGGVSASVRDAVRLSETGTLRVDASLEQVRTSAEQLRRMTAFMQDTSASVRQISAAVTQQNAGVSEIFAAVDDLSTQMQDTLERVRQNEAATRLVQRVAESLGEMRAPDGRAA